MKITFIPTSVDSSSGDLLDMSHAILRRENTAPRIIMSDIVTKSMSTSEPQIRITGQPVGDFSISDLQDGDIIFYPSSYATPVTLEMFATNNTLTPFETSGTIASLAAGLEDNDSLVLSIGNIANDKMTKALNVYTSLKPLYARLPKYRTIMMKENDKPVSKSLAQLVAAQTEEVQSQLEVYLLSITAGFMSERQSELSAQKILTEIPFDEYFQLLTEEEQVGHFIEFSKMSSAEKKEHVSDELINIMTESDEYQASLELLSSNGLGVSETQQFNVLQQVGYFSTSRTNKNLLYNLSDMGAGKTLMTVQAIAILDMKQIAEWFNNPLSEDFEGHIRLPDKHIITPTLSVRSSWIDTFKMFYDVEEINDHNYDITMNYMGKSVKSRICVAPFTIKNALIFVGEKLPVAHDNTYLIIDEIHQLVKRPLAKTKFFPPATNPVDIYKTFVLSGTLSNLLTREWLTFMRFMSLPITSSTPAVAKEEIAKSRDQLRKSIVSAVDSIRTEHRRQTDTDEFTRENFFDVPMPDKAMTTINEEFFTNYGVQILTSPFDVYSDKEAFSFDEYIDALANGRVEFKIEENEVDTTNFKLFYDIVGSQSITAQSQTIAEELFGDQQIQHTSDIIKTSSPLSTEDIKILKTLHNIAEDHSHYKSLKIAKDINTAILNLNDGLQTQNIYQILTRAAERNIRFFEYLTTLDINVLERLPQSNLISMPKLEDTEKFQILQDILKREEAETHLIVVNDFSSMTALSKALGVESISRAQLRDELSYQDTLDEMFEKQSIVVVTQDMIKSSLDLVQANRLIQYQLNTEISDIIQTQNRINRIGQTRETRGYYIASDALQENLIDLFLASYQNIRVAHKGIVELFVDVTSQINIVNNYLAKAFENLDVEDDTTEEVEISVDADILNVQTVTEGDEIISVDNITDAVLYPQDGQVFVTVSLTTGAPFSLGTLSDEKVAKYGVVAPIMAKVNLETLEVQL